MQTYANAGVSIEAGDALVEAIKPLAKATARPGAGAALGGFGALFDLKAAGFADPILVASNDGVGTKLKIAIEMGLHDNVGVDLVAMCANDVVVQGAEPLFFLDYFACGVLETDVAQRVIAGIAEGCRQAGAALIGGETAEMPGMYAAGDYDLAGFCVGAAERGALLPRDGIAAGDVLIGVASSGLHSNGFSMVRHVLRSHGLQLDAPAPFDRFRMLGEALLTPTRVYVKAALAAVKTGHVKALAHITGGGLPGNVPRMLPETVTAVIDPGCIPRHPVFGWIAHQGNVAEAEMLRIFNCGAGLAAVTAPEHEAEIVSVFEAAGERAFRIGHLEARGNGPVRFIGALDLRA